MGDDRLAVVAHRILSTHHPHAIGPGRLLRKAHSGDLRICVNTAWNHGKPCVHSVGDHRQLDCVGPPRNILHHKRPLGRGHMGQLDIRHHVSDGVDPGYAGHKAVIDSKPPLLHLKLHVLAKQPFHIGRPPNGHQHLARGDILFFPVPGHPAHQSVAALCDLQDRGIAVNRDPLLLQFFLQSPGHILVHRPQKLAPLLDNCHFRAQGTENGSHLHADHTAAHNGDPVKFPAVCPQKLVAAVHSCQIDPRNIRHPGLGSGGNDNVLGLEIILARIRVYLHMAIPPDHSPPMYQLNPQLLKLLLHASAVGLHRFLLILLHLFKIKGHLLNADAELVASLHHGKLAGSV